MSIAISAGPRQPHIRVYARSRTIAALDAMIAETTTIDFKRPMIAA
jgi:hypothetical protein